MNVNELVAIFRNETADVEAPYLWTDDEVITYLNDAYTMFVRFLGGVPDSTSEVCTVPFLANAETIALDATIIRVVRAFRQSDGVEVNIIENTDTPLVKDSSGKLSLLRVGSSTGPVQFLVLGSDPLTAALHPVPVAGDSLLMQVRRLPTNPLVIGTASPTDIRAEHHLHLLKWVKAQAYRKQDSETLDLDKAQLNETLFLEYCTQSVNEQERMRRKSRTSLRTSRDLKNPMLNGSAYTRYGQPSASKNPNQQNE
jgi:hypothetical protein